MIAVALLAEFSEAAEILADLGRGEAELLAELKGGDARDTAFIQFIQLPQIARQPAYYIIRYFSAFQCPALLVNYFTISNYSIIPNCFQEKIRIFPQIRNVPSAPPPGCLRSLPRGDTIIHIRYK